MQHIMKHVYINYYSLMQVYSISHGIVLYGCIRNPASTCVTSFLHPGDNTFLYGQLRALKFI